MAELISMKQNVFVVPQKITRKNQFVNLLIKTLRSTCQCQLLNLSHLNVSRGLDCICHA